MQIYANLPVAANAAKFASATPATPPVIIFNDDGILRGRKTQNRMRITRTTRLATPIVDINHDVVEGEQPCEVANGGRSDR